MKVSRADRFGIIDFLKTGKAKHGILLTKGGARVDGKIVTLPLWVFLLLV